MCPGAVEKVANESPKTPRDVVMMENFHHIFSTLSRLKISCLETERKEAKQKYTDHLQYYVINSLGQPLEKLNVRSRDSQEFSFLDRWNDSELKQYRFSCTELSFLFFFPFVQD